MDKSKPRPQQQRDREFEMAKWDEYTSLVRAPLAAADAHSAAYQATAGTGTGIGGGREAENHASIMVGHDPIFSCCEKIMWLIVKILSISVVFGALLCEFILIIAIARTNNWKSAALILDLYGVAFCGVSLLLEWRPAIFGHQQYSSWAAKGLIYILSGSLTLNAADRSHISLPFPRLHAIPGEALVVCGFVFVVLEACRVRKVFRNAFPEGMTTDNAFQNVRTFYEEGYITRTESYDF